MKILGCFKVVGDFDLVAEEDWTADDQLKIDTSYIKPLWNCFDEGALEMMLKLSDLSEGFGVVCQLNALTVGTQKHESFLKTLFALGFEHGVRIEAEEELAFCPEKVAAWIADYVQEQAPQDVIFTGVQSADGSNAKTPYLLAEKLGWPCVSQVTAVEPVDETSLKVMSEVAGGSLVQVIRTPCVLAVGNAACAYLRVPTLKDKMRTKNKPVERIQPEEKERSKEAQIKLTALAPVIRKRNTVVIEGETPQEKAAILYQDYLKGRLEQL
jgi:electron transfer flavoprotein alpha/beta subunit